MTALFTTLILGFGALIAYFQWRTAHQRVVLDLFERRLAVFSDLEEGAKGVLNAVAGKDMQDPFWLFVRAKAKARFLFGSEITKLLTERLADIAAVMSFSDIRFDHPEYAQMINRKQIAENNLAAFIQNSAEPFEPYMRLDQKMNLWWPLHR